MTTDFKGGKMLLMCINDILIIFYKKEKKNSVNV